MSSSKDKDIELVDQEESPPKEDKWLDDLLQLRWYSLRVLLMVTLATFTSLASNTFMVFAGETPRIIGCDDYKVDNCHDLRAIQNSTGCKPVLEVQFLSTQVEFNYICDDTKLVKNTITIQIFGVLVGAAKCRAISDHIGRRNTLLITSLGCALSCFAVVYTNDLITFTIVRTFCGFFSGGLAVVQTMFKLENISKRHLCWIQNVISWSAMLTIFPLVAYYSQDWRTLSIVIGGTSSFTFLSVLLLLHESPRWFIQRREFRNAFETLIAIRKIDGMYNEEFEEEACEVLSWEKKAMKKSSGNFKIKFEHFNTKWKVRTLILMTGIACTSAIVYSLMFHLEHLAGSMFWNCTFIGASRWLLNCLIALLDSKFNCFGRKMASLISMALTAAILAIITGSIYIGKCEMVLTIGTIVATSICSQLLILKYQMVNNLYPSNLRQIAVSAVSTMSRIGSMFSPQIFYLTEYAEWLPYALLFCLQIYDLVVFSINIPETKGAHLMQQTLFGSRRKRRHTAADN